MVPPNVQESIGAYLWISRVHKAVRNPVNQFDVYPVQSGFQRYQDPRKYDTNFNGATLTQI